MPATLVPALLGLAALGGLLVLGIGFSLDANLVTLALPLLLGGAALVVWWGRPKQLLIAALFLTAPIDISKALVAPLDQFYSPGLYITIGHICLLGLAGLWLSWRLVVERRLPPFGPLDAWVLVFLSLVWVGALRSSQGQLAVASAVSYSLGVLGFYVTSHALTSERDWRTALQACMVILLVQMVYVALQFVASSPLSLPGSKALQVGSVLTFGGTGQTFRPIGFFEHPNALANHVALALPPLLALVLMGRHRLPRWVWWSALITLGAAGGQLLLSLSRGGWVSAVLGMGVVTGVYWYRRLLSTRQMVAGGAALLVAVMLAVAAYPAILLRLTAPDDRSTESRLILNNQALAIIKTSPWIGVGYGSYNRAAYETVAPAFALISPEYQKSLLQLVVHNHYLLLAAELGIPAAVYFVGLMLMFLRLPWTVKRWHDPALYALAIGLSGSVACQLLFLNSDNYYADIRVFMMWLMLGLLRGVCRRGREQDRHHGTPTERGVAA